MLVFIQLTTVGFTAGPFDLYSDVDGYAVAFASAVPKATLIAGATYNITGIPTNIKVQSIGVCTNFELLTVIPLTTTTSTTTTTTSTTTSSTTTGTTTTAPLANCYFYNIPDASLTSGGEDLYITYETRDTGYVTTDYLSWPDSGGFVGGIQVGFCAKFEPIFKYGISGAYFEQFWLYDSCIGCCTQDTDCIPV